MLNDAHCHFFSTPFFAALGKKVVHAGPVGAGHALKALNNLLSATSFLITLEAIAAGARFGLDPSLRTVLVAGGSLGAHQINLAVSEMLRDLLEHEPAPARRGWTAAWQGPGSGPQDIPR